MVKSLLSHFLFPGSSSHFNPEMLKSQKSLKSLFQASQGLLDGYGSPISFK